MRGALGRDLTIEWVAADEIERLRAELAAIKDVGMEPVCFVSAELPNGDCFGAMAYQNKCGEDHEPLYSAAQLAKVQSERDEAKELCRFMADDLDERRAQVALAREALEKLLESTVVEQAAIIEDALSALTTGNAVQQIEARAYERAAKVCDEYDNGRHANAADLCADAIRKLAEQKEQ